jgi:hypothetical protein
MKKIFSSSKISQVPLTIGKSSRGTSASLLDSRSLTKSQFNDAKNLKRKKFYDAMGLKNLEKMEILMRCLLGFKEQPNAESI